MTFRQVFQLPKSKHSSYIYVLTYVQIFISLDRKDSVFVTPKYKKSM